MIDIDYLLSSQAVRERSKKILELTEAKKGLFRFNRNRLEDAAQFVSETIKDRYPKLNIPYHARSGHLKVGGIDRIEDLNKKLGEVSPIERARAMVDLIVTSVLLDAGAGAQWKFQEPGGQVYARSEGLAVASYNLFVSGAFSSDPSEDPLRADGRGLLHLTEEVLSKGFQVSVGNPLLGLKGRVDLLQRLGKLLERDLVFFGSGPVKRIGHLVDFIEKEYPSKEIEAKDLLRVILKSLGGIWPGRVIMNDVNLGDCWVHEDLGKGPSGFIPFHKLSQWLTYSLLEPLEDFGFKINNLDELTGLAEYRNGGLFVDTGVIEPVDKSVFSTPLRVDSKFIIEWRALTVSLLDELAPLVRKNLNLSQESFPLAKVLEGGTWWAGRRLAQKARGGSPPFELISDGTVF